ncbi:hypothetical protein [Bacillus haynesii]|uniref:hypothetical protein n=1 Tax=Bacillus haynesii TaxID=1925021 RepID=UPI001F0ACDBD|nr:hypothetical protein [Bacillus haynesii]
MNYTECPACGNKQIIEYGEDTFRYERSARTGKLLRRSLGSFKYRCIGIAIRNSLKWMKMTRGRKDEVDTRTHQNYEGYLGEGINDKN